MPEAEACSSSPSALLVHGSVAENLEMEMVEGSVQQGKKAEDHFLLGNPEVKPEFNGQLTGRREVSPK